MENFSYYHSKADTYSIDVNYSHQNKRDFFNYLNYIEEELELKKNSIRNKIIIGENAYTEGHLIIVVDKNQVINFKANPSSLLIKKRVQLKNNYIEYTFKYNFRTNKYKFQVIRNESGKITDITHEFDQTKEIMSMVDSNKEIKIWSNFTIINDKICIIDGENAIEEISNDEISLYSKRQSNEDIDTLSYQRYIIVKNDTKEIVGNVTFNFYQTNISYCIIDKFRGNHFAGKALKLMLELLKNNQNFAKDNLYVRIYPNNLASIKTAEFCKLEIVNDQHLLEYVVNPQKVLTVK